MFMHFTDRDSNAHKLLSKAQRTKMGHRKAPHLPETDILGEESGYNNITVC